MPKISGVIPPLTSASLRLRWRRRRKLAIQPGDVRLHRGEGLRGLCDGSGPQRKRARLHAARNHLGSRERRAQSRQLAWRSLRFYVEGARANPSLLAAEDVAALLGVPTSWVYEQSRRGRIPTVTLGRYRRYRREAIDAWIAELEAPARGARAFARGV